MRYFHEINTEEAMDAMGEIMMSLDDDLVATIKPMRRDCLWEGVRVFFRRDGMEWKPDPLYCHLLWLDSRIAHERNRESMHEEEAKRYLWMMAIRDNLVAQLDAAWGM